MKAPIITDVVVSHIPKKAIVSYTSSITEHDEDSSRLMYCLDDQLTKVDCTKLEHATRMNWAISFPSFLVV